MRTTKPWASIKRISSISRNPTTSIECRKRIAKHNERVNAFVCVSPLLSLAEGVDALPLGGRPVAVKDTIATQDMRTTCASSMLRNFSPPYDATVVKLLRTAGADIIGKTNCDEFGMGSLNKHSIYGPVVNPFGSLSSHTSQNSHPRSAGGSSGGSAAAVAAGMCYAALGTDTGGSTRLPASYCGIVGLKPSYGLLSRWGVVSFADSLDCVGVMAATVADTRRIFRVLDVHDPKDPTSATTNLRHRAAAACTQRLRALELDSSPSQSQLTLRGLRIGIPQEYFPEEITPTILDPLRRTIASLRDLGATIVPVSMPATKYALSAYYVLASAEASSCLSRFDGVQYGLNVQPPPGTEQTTAGIYAYSRSAGFGSEVQKRILLGTYALSAGAFDNYFLQAQRARQLVKDDFDRVFSTPDYRNRPEGEKEEETNIEGVDVLIHPSAIQTAPELGKEGEDGVATYVQDVLTVPASLAGVPALSVPVPREMNDGWPVGVSIIGQWGCEELVFNVGQTVGGLICT